MTDINERGWRRIQHDPFPQNLLAELEKERPDYSILRKWYIDKFSDEIKTDFDPETAEPDRLVEFAQWLAFQDLDAAGSLQFRVRRRLERLLSFTHSAKANSIAQRHCYVCDGPRPATDLFPIRHIPIRIRPVSRQAARYGLFKAYRAAIKDNFYIQSDYKLPPGPLCLAFTFVLSDRGTDKDVDNMAKALQDALAEALGFNDSRVHHLDVAKIILSDDEEYVYVRIAPSFINDHFDVLSPIRFNDWAGQERVEPEDFLPKMPPNET